MGMARDIMMYDIKQIYYNDESKASLLDYFTPYENTSPTMFLENTVISEEVKKCDAQYFGVVSHKVRHKINNFPYDRNEQKIGRGYFERVLPSCNILVLQRVAGNMMQQLEAWHAGSTDTLQMILDAIGYHFNVGSNIKWNVYSNHFIARYGIYEEYVRLLLDPAMAVMESDKNIKRRCMIDSGYTTLTGPPPEHLQKAWGIGYWPMHPFLCERMFSIYIDNKNYNVKYL